MLPARAFRAGEGFQSLPQGDGMRQEFELLIMIPGGVIFGYAALYLVMLVHS